LEVADKLIAVGRIGGIARFFFIYDIKAVKTFVDLNRFFNDFNTF
jgi:hypothetical protein